MKYTRMDLEGLEVYLDLKEKTKYYYAPGDLHLVKDHLGKPVFKLVQMRYTGTAATGDQGEQRFMNIVQFKVEMEHLDKDEIEKLKSALGRNVSLHPIPLRNIEAFLVAPFEGKYRRLGNAGSFQDDKGSNTSITSYWTHRTFTVRLENHEAQLLWDMVENGNIALSVSYTYYADMIPGVPSEAKVGGSHLPAYDIDGQMEELTRMDTVPSLQIVRAGAFNIHVDVQAFPDVLVQTDLNQGVPPAYAAMQVACFDFTDNLRPDLAMKTIEFEAVGVDGNLVSLRSEKFFPNNPDQHTRQIRFPYAVNMRKPLRYRIKEYTESGDIHDSGWLTRDSWSGGFDITTRAQDIGFERRTMEFETEPALMREKGISKLVLLLSYSYLDAEKDKIVEIGPTDFPVTVITLLCDKNVDVLYQPQWVFDSGERINGLKTPVSIDNYVFLNIPAE